MPHRQSSPSRSARKPSTADNTGESKAQTQTAEELALAVIEANQRWWALQIEAMQAALAENTQQSKAMLENASKTSDSLAQWPQFYEGKLRRYTDLTRSGLDIATQMFAQLNQLMGQLFSVSLTGLTGTTGFETGPEIAGETSGEVTERRVAAHIISFPDRRKSSQLQAESAKSMTSGQAQLARRRKSA